MDKNPSNRARLCSSTGVPSHEFGELFDHRVCGLIRRGCDQVHQEFDALQRKTLEEEASKREQVLRTALTQSLVRMNQIKENWGILPSIPWDETNAFNHLCNEVERILRVIREMAFVRVQCQYSTASTSGRNRPSPVEAYTDVMDNLSWICMHYYDLVRQARNLYRLQDPDKDRRMERPLKSDPYRGIIGPNHHIFGREEQYMRICPHMRTQGGVNFEKLCKGIDHL